eukprot:5422534-Pyramimonas_sp.AAC.1
MNDYQSVSVVYLRTSQSGCRSYEWWAGRFTEQPHRWGMHIIDDWWLSSYDINRRIVLRSTMRRRVGRCETI